MTQVADDKEFAARMRKLDELLEQAQTLADPVARETTSQIVQTLMEFHGAGISRILERIADAGELGQSIIHDLGQDEVVSGLLLLYGQHPQDLDARVRQGLEKCKPYLQSHGGNVELLKITDEGAVHLKMQGSCGSCPSSAITLKNTIEQAIYDMAPEVTAIIVAGLEAPAPQGKPGFVPVGQLLTSHNKQLLQGQLHAK